MLFYYGRGGLATWRFPADFVYLMTIHRSLWSRLAVGDMVNRQLEEFGS
jgi:hypothetical protein